MVAHSNLSHSGGRAFEITPKLQPVVFNWWLITVTDGVHPWCSRGGGGGEEGGEGGGDTLNAFCRLCSGTGWQCVEALHY